MLKYICSMLLLFQSLSDTYSQDWNVFGQGGGHLFYMIDSTSYLVEKNGNLIKYKNGTPKVVFYNENKLDGINDVADDGQGTIYVAGDFFNSTTSRLLKSTDQGETWEDQSVPNIRNATRVYFINKDVGFICGDDTRILRTENGGMTWKKVYDRNYVWVQSMTFINELEGFAVGGRAVETLSIKTTDGGKTWKQWLSCGYECNSVFFSSGCVGYTSSLYGVKKIDRNTNTSINLDVPDGLGYGPVYFINDLIGYLPVWNNVIGSPGFYNEAEMYITFDGGLTWTIQSISEVIALPGDFRKVNDKLYMNCGNSTNETPDHILVTGLPAHSTFTFRDSIIHPSCHGQSDGEIHLDLVAGLPPFEIIWTPSSLSGVSIDSLAAGKYSIMIQDASGLCESRVITLQEPPEVQASVKIKNTLNHRANGNLTVNVTDGLLPFTYQWSHADSLTTSIASGLAAGFYHITVTDGNGCQKILHAMVSNASPLGSNSEFTITPNPIWQGELIVRARTSFLPNTTYSVYNLTGQKMISGYTGSGNEVLLDCSGVMSGVYYLLLEYGIGQSWICPVIVQ